MATYKESGVDIDAGAEMVNGIAGMVNSTFNKYVLKDIGAFGGFYEIPQEYKNPVLVSSVDGVGTKLKVAFLTGKHDTVGQCLVNHCVNDILVCGAKPLYFMDYFASGKLEPEIGKSVVSGFVKACIQNNCALIGGETAEMPDFYTKGEYDISGTIVGIVEKTEIIDGSSICESDVIIGLPSNGLHTNGYSLARKVLFEKYSVNDEIDELGCKLGDELLRIHKSYLQPITKLFNNVKIRGLSHITGGGLIGNTSRILPEHLKLNVDWGAWKEPAIFKLIRKIGSVPDEDMKKTFNLGVGIVIIVAEHDLDSAFEVLSNEGEHPFVIGKVEKK